MERKSWDKMSVEEKAEDLHNTMSMVLGIVEKLQHNERILATEIDKAKASLKAVGARVFEIEGKLKVKH